MKLLTISVIVVVVVGVLVCVTGPLNVHADAIEIPPVSSELSPPVTDSPHMGSASEELVMPPDLMQFVEEQYTHDLAIEVNVAAKEYRATVALCWEVVRQEATFHHYDSDGEIKRGSSGEYGICQILVDGMAIKKRHNVQDRADNIRCMAELLSFALFERGYSLERALGWYNTGKSVTNGYARKVAKAYRFWVIQRGGTPL